MLLIWLGVVHIQLLEAQVSPVPEMGLSPVGTNVSCRKQPQESQGCCRQQGCTGTGQPPTASTCQAVLVLSVGKGAYLEPLPAPELLLRPSQPHADDVPSTASLAAAAPAPFAPAAPAVPAALALFPFPAAAHAAAAAFASSLAAFAPATIAAVAAAAASAAPRSPWGQAVLARPAGCAHLARRGGFVKGTRDNAKTVRSNVRIRASRQTDKLISKLMMQPIPYMHALHSEMPTTSAWQQRIAEDVGLPHTASECPAKSPASRILGFPNLKALPYLKPKFTSNWPNRCCFNPSKEEVLQSHNNSTHAETNKQTNKQTNRQQPDGMLAPGEV